MISLAGPWNAGTGFNNSLPIDKKVVLPMIGKSGIYITVFIAVAIMLVYYLVMNKSRWGYEMRVTGENIAAMSLFIAGITNGANSLQSFGVDQSIADFARGLILLIILAVDYVTRFNICIREKEPKSKNSADDTAKNTGDISKEAAK